MSKLDVKTREMPAHERHKESITHATRLKSLYLHGVRELRAKVTLFFTLFARYLCSTGPQLLYSLDSHTIENS